jgi:hypothetical protein
LKTQLTDWDVEMALLFIVLRFFSGNFDDEDEETGDGAS